MKHPHAEMIIEWANDTSKQPQVFHGNDGKWYNCSISDLIIQEDDEYRFKPREFNEGEWYQVVRSFPNDDNVGVAQYVKGDFFVFGKAFVVADFEWIGESLGKLKFG